MTPNDELCLALDEILSKPGGLKVLSRDETLKERLAVAYIAAGADWIDLKDIFRKNKAVRDGIPIVISKSRELQNVASIGGNPREGAAVKEAWPDAPVADDACVPPEYGLKEPRAAIYRREQRTVDGNVAERRVTVSYDPVFITKRMQQKETGRQLLELAWRVGKRWHSEVFDRDDVFSSRDIVKTAAFGMPVGSDNAFELVQYLRAYENENRSNIVPAYATSSMGWIGDEEDPTKHGFMCGRRQLGGNGKAFELRVIGAGESDEAARIRTHGSFEQWKEAIEPLQRFPVMKLLFYAMLTPVLQPIVDAPNAIFEVVNRTSKSKTFAVMMAQSIWRSASDMPRTWDNTLNNFESLAHLYSGIPLFIDDTKLVVKQMGQKGEEQLGKAIYKFVAGVGRGRDSKDGGQRSVARWRSVLISTGENPSSDLTHAEGAAARVLSFWTLPTGPKDSAVGAMVDGLVYGELSRHYGHAGPHVVNWLHEHRDQWDLLRGAYDERTRLVRQKFDSPAATRLARMVALLDVAAAVGHLANCFPWEGIPLLEDKQISDVLDQAMMQASTASDQAEQAWRHVISYAEARSAQWISWGREPNDDDAPNGGWLGWRSEMKSRLGWLPSQLRRALSDGNFNTDTILRAWHDVGVLDNPTAEKVDCGAHGGPDHGRRRLFVVKTEGTPWD